MGILGHFARVSGLASTARQAKAAGHHFADLGRAGTRTVAESRETIRRYRGMPDPALEAAQEAYREWADNYGSVGTAKIGLVALGWVAAAIFAYCVYLGATAHFAGIIDVINVTGPIPIAAMLYTYSSYKLWIIRKQACLSWRQWFDAISECPSELIPH